MQLSTAGLDLLKRSEGFRSRVYLDLSGLPTIGYGHKLVNPESFIHGVDEVQATKLLAVDVLEAEHAIGRLVKVPLEQGQFDALVDFVYNLGSGRLASSTLLVDLNAKKYAAAGEQLLRWDHADGRENSELKARREAEFKLWLNGEEPAQVAA
jgi:lysozyme